MKMGICIIELYQVVEIEVSLCQIHLFSCR